MSTAILTAYILVWPTITAVVLAVLCVAVAKDHREAKKNNTTVV